MKYKSGKQFKDWLFKVVMIGTVAVFGYFMIKDAIVETFESNGYCFEKGKYLSEIYTEQELIDRAMEDILDSIYSVLVLPEDITFNFRNREYLSVEDFKFLNPDCCKLIYGKIPDGLQKNVFLNVELRYWIYLPTEHRYRNFTDYIPYSSCGINSGEY